MCRTERYAGMDTIAASNIIMRTKASGLHRDPNAYITGSFEPESEMHIGKSQVDRPFVHGEALGYRPNRERMLGTTYANARCASLQLTRERQGLRWSPSLEAQGWPVK